jgi:hypothetical protein
VVFTARNQVRENAVHAIDIAKRLSTRFHRRRPTSRSSSRKL